MSNSEENKISHDVVHIYNITTEPKQILEIEYCISNKSIVDIIMNDYCEIERKHIELKNLKDSGILKDNYGDTA